MAAAGMPGWFLRLVLKMLVVRDLYRAWLRAILLPVVQLRTLLTVFAWQRSWVAFLWWMPSTWHQLKAPRSWVIREWQP